MPFLTQHLIPLERAHREMVEEDLYFLTTELVFAGQVRSFPHCMPKTCVQLLPIITPCVPRYIREIHWSSLMGRSSCVTWLLAPQFGKFPVPDMPHGTLKSTFMGHVRIHYVHTNVLADISRRMSILMLLLLNIGTSACRGNVRSTWTWICLKRRQYSSHSRSGVLLRL